MPIRSNHALMIAATPGVAGISRWLAPELINPPRKKGYRQPAGTEQADIFAFAMLDIEVFTGELPFGDVRHQKAVLMISRERRPEKPCGAESRGLTTEIWEFIQRCWHQNPTERPDIGAVVTAWQNFDSQAADPIHQEKHQSHLHKPFVESTGEILSLRTHLASHLNPTQTDQRKHVSVDCFDLLIVVLAGCILVSRSASVRGSRSRLRVIFIIMINAFTHYIMLHSYPSACSTVHNMRCVSQDYPRGLLQMFADPYTLRPR